MRTHITLILFSVCLMLNSCVQKTHEKVIHFTLDMNGIQNPEKVGVRGEFGQNPWNETFYMSDDNNDNIFEGTIIKMTGQGGMDFKFVNKEDEFELEGQANRTIPFKYQPETIYYEAIFNNAEATIKIE